MSEIYFEEFERVARRAFAMWNREPASSSCGSFDRQYWGWKYKDFSDATLQFGVRLAIRYAESRKLTSSMPILLDGYIEYCGKIQLSDGSFNQCYPYERTPGVIYDILSTLIAVRQSPYLKDAGASARLEQIIKRAVGFVLKTDEKHGEVANHLAEFSYELFLYAAYAEDPVAKTRAYQYLERFLAHFDAEEGWFLEYNGPDPGYQTRCLRFLAKTAAILDSDELWGVTKKAADFVGELLMPDGSLHPMLGCRSTALLYPSTFEDLAIRDPGYQSLARRVRYAWDKGLVPLPSTLDFDNAIRLADDAWDAHQAWASNPERCTELCAADIPTCDRDFPHAGILIRRTSTTACYIGHAIGGVFVAYKKTRAGQWRLFLEDSGYLIKGLGETEAWMTRMPGCGQLLKSKPGKYVIKTPFSRILHDDLTPPRLILLRLLNLTLLRQQWVGDLFRKLVVRTLINRTVADALSLIREIEIGVATIRVTDEFQGVSRLLSTTNAAWRCRRMIGTHMASSRYFQDQELEELPMSWTEPIPWPIQLGKKMTRTFNIETESEV